MDKTGEPCKCPACGSDCNERDELIKAEREIERLAEALASLVPDGYALVPRKLTPQMALAIESADCPTSGSTTLVDFWQPSWDAAIAAARS
jgi:hypothetical protein